MGLQDRREKCRPDTVSKTVVSMSEKFRTGMNTISVEKWTRFASSDEESRNTYGAEKVEYKSKKVSTNMF